MSATVGNDICTFPDYPADIRAPQGSLTGVSGFQVHVGASKIFTPGDHCHVLVAMNPAALKTQIKFCKPQGLVITDSDSFGEKDLEKAQFKTGNPFEEWESHSKCLKSPSRRCVKKASKIQAGQQSHVALQKHVRSRFGMLVIQPQPVCCRKNAEREIAKKPEIAAANIKVLNDGYNYGANTHASTSTYKIESKTPKAAGSIPILMVTKPLHTV